jgi:hypothetical protein
VHPQQSKAAIASQLPTLFNLVNPSFQKNFGKIFTHRGASRFFLTQVNGRALAMPAPLWHQV